MSEKVKSGLLVLIAGLLVVNTVLLIQQDTPAIPSASNKFERAEVTKTDSKPVVKDNTKLTTAVDPMSLAAEKPAGPTTNVSFAETSHDFGSVSQDSENTKIFTFTNTGSEPLIIENAKGSCGCTVPKYPKEPIAPGGTGEIEVVYKPGKQQNKQTKTVTITANTEPAKSILTITADVQVAGV
jgi:hypothetical protein